MSSSSNSPPGEAPEDQMKSPSELSSHSETLDGAPLVPSFPNLDGASVESPPRGDAPPPVVAAEDIYASIFDEEAEQEDPGESSPFRALTDDSPSPWASLLASDACRSLNSSRVSAIMAPEVWNPEPGPDISWLFPGGDKGSSSKGEISDSAVVASSMIGAGLTNLGNTCFLNAILQCFTHTVPLVQGLRSCSHSASRDGHAGRFCVLCAFRDQIERSLVSSGKVISPLKLVDNLNHFSSMFRKHQQEDAHEFMQCALDKLERCFLDLKKNVGLEDDNIVEKVFGGRLLSKLRCCNCGHTSDTYEPLIDLSLEIENVDTLSSALESFTKVENIDAKFRCDSCEEEVSMEKQLMLDQTPSIATFHLKRFKTDGIRVEKIDKHVNFPLELDLQPYTISNENNNVSLKYDLYAVVVHNGSSSTSGHYFCFVRTAPDTWHQLDDAMVTKVSGDSVLSQEAYILFYARQGTPWFSSIMESPNPCLDPSAMNTSPKSVLDIVDGPNKSNPILNANIERTEASESKESSEQLSDYTCREGPEFLEINDINDALGLGQIFAWSNQESVNLAGSKDVDTQVLPENNAILNGIAKLDGNSYTENGALDKNKCSSKVVNFRENDGFHPLTPPSSPSDAPDKSFQISRDHLKMENQGSCKGSSNKFMADSERKAAIKYVSKMHGSRREALLGELVGFRREDSLDNKRKKMDSSQSKKDNTISARKKRNHTSVIRPVAAGISQ